MLLDETEALEFLDRYKRLISDCLGREPSSLEEWLTARDAMLAELATGSLENEQTELAEVIAAATEAVVGDFCFLKRYRDHCAFFHLESQLFYAVRALTTPIEEIVADFTLIRACLVPFRGKIICDGLISNRNVGLGRNYEKQVRDGYWAAKNEGGLIGLAPKPKRGKKRPQSSLTTAPGVPTRTQGQYLAFLYYFTKVNGIAPAESDFRQYFGVSSPTVHQMIVRLEKAGYLSRTPGQARSLRLLLSREQIPDLE